MPAITNNETALTVIHLEKSITFIDRTYRHIDNLLIIHQQQWPHQNKQQTHIHVQSSHCVSIKRPILCSPCQIITTGLYLNTGITVVELDGQQHPTSWMKM